VGLVDIALTLWEVIFMKLTTKTRYGVRALFDMAYHAGTLPVQVKDISRRQEISPRYLEQIFQVLKKAGLLHSKRGPQGGYSLARPPAEITLLDIITATEGRIALLDCSEEGGEKNGKSSACERMNHCVTQTLWAEAGQHLEAYFASVTLKDICDKARALGMERELDHRFMYFI
jgi:Rrf2 family protein